VPITDVAGCMGHKDIRETFNTYSHFMPEAEDRGVAVLDAEYAEWSRTLFRNSVCHALLLEQARAKRCRFSNAGVTCTAPFEYAQLERVREIIEVNLVAPYLVTQACLPMLRRHNGAAPDQ
jgi:NAD(P)-dependent dehydrogenase (short-subunit alcohol dehydrogenase family)